MLFQPGIILIISTLVAIALADLIVDTPNGKLRGLEKFSAKNRTYFAFLQVPYAQPPVGKLRFRDPQPVLAWTGILNATQETKMCYQMSSNTDNENEDCLYLNIYTPSTTNMVKRAKSLPVMLFIHGGGFMNGNASFTTLGPQYFMDTGVVVVTILYRLGPFGFLSTQDSVVPGNYGLKDQTLALKWVQENIRSFGGNPNKVTIFGQSSGAVSVGYHILSKQSKGLFRGAVQQSGAVLTPHGYQRRAKSFAYALAKLINPSFNDAATSEELLDFLQNATSKQIDLASEEFMKSPPLVILSDGSWFAPVIEPESETAFITENMHVMLEKGNINKVPVMLGFTSEEIISIAADLDEFKQTVQGFDNNLTLLVQADMHIDDQVTKAQVGEDVRKIYSDGLLQDNLGGAIRLLSDSFVTRPVLRQARLQSDLTNVYFYQFSYDGALGGVDVHVEGAGTVSHSEDMRYLWVIDNYNDYVDVGSIAPRDLEAVARVVKLFTNFAKNLNPTPKKDGLLQNVTWPKATSQNFRYLDFDEDLTVKVDPREPAYSKWVDIYNKWGIPPFDTY